VAPNKAIIGRNAFAHESGIHQDGVLKERSTYEIMDAATIGLDGNSLVLGKHSGRHALQQALAELGFFLEGDALKGAFERFKSVADRKKQITAMDLEAIATDGLRAESDGYRLAWFEVETSSKRTPHASVGITAPTGEELVGSSDGDGPLDAVMRAIAVATGMNLRLREFNISSVTHGRDSLGDVSIVGEIDGVTASGQGVSPDTVEATAHAYLRALSSIAQRSVRSSQTDSVEKPKS
jgi:2-isopropylmalate synthase